MERFAREYGCTEAEWRRWMPQALQDHEWQTRGPCALSVRLGQGALDLEWTVLAPRQIALVRLPRMQVAFAFSGVDASQRERFMRHFDLHLQRGGG